MLTISKIYFITTTLCDNWGKYRYEPTEQKITIHKDLYINVNQHGRNINV